MTFGVIYQFSGMAAAELLVASLCSLRRHYRGDVTIFATEPCMDLARRIATDRRLRCDVLPTQLLPIDVPHQKRLHCLSKSCTYLLAPYDQTLFLDADTIINHPITPFFRPGINVTGFGSGRLRDQNRTAVSLWHECSVLARYGPGLRRLIQQASEHNLPWINTGAWSFPRHHPALWEIYLLCSVLRNTLRTSDESAINAISWRLTDLEFLPDRCHRSSMYWEGNWREPVVLHNNSRNWVRRSAGRNSFKHYLTWAMDRDVAGITQWLGDGHHYVPKLWGDILAQRAGKREPASL